jgi:hypothetical protein
VVAQIPHCYLCHEVTVSRVIQPVRHRQLNAVQPAVANIRSCRDQAQGDVRGSPVVI